MLAVAAAFALIPGTSARAQAPSIRAEPLPPLQQQQWLIPPTRSFTPDRPQDNQEQAPPPAVAPPTTMERPNSWLPATTVKLQALDKVNAQAAALTVKVGQTATFGSLSITAKACVVRPPDQPADAAAFLDITDSHPDSANFDGWLLQAEPSLSMLQHPVYDLRVTGCT